MTPLFGERQAIEFFSNLALMNSFRRNNTTLPGPRESYILSSINSSKRLWLLEPHIQINAITEGQRLACLLYKHASKMTEDRDFFVKAYFPSCFMMANIEGCFDGKWQGNHKQEEAYVKFGEFLRAAREKFMELAEKDGFWDVGMDE